MKRIKVGVLLLLLLLVLLWLFFYFREILHKEMLSFEEHPLNFCSVHEDCFIYSYSNCGCTARHAINIQYENDKDVLEKYYPITPKEECTAVCGTSAPGTYQAFCRDGLCGLRFSSSLEKKSRLDKFLDILYY